MAKVIQQYEEWRERSEGSQGRYSELAKIKQRFCTVLKERGLKRVYCCTHCPQYLYLLKYEKKEDMCAHYEEKHSPIAMPQDYMYFLLPENLCGQHNCYNIPTIPTNAGLTGSISHIDTLGYETCYVSSQPLSNLDVNEVMKFLQDLDQNTEVEIPFNYEWVDKTDSVSLSGPEQPYCVLSSLMANMCLSPKTKYVRMMILIKIANTTIYEAPICNRRFLLTTPNNRKHYESVSDADVVVTCVEVLRGVAGLTPLWINAIHSVIHILNRLTIGIDEKDTISLLHDARHVNIYTSNGDVIHNGHSFTIFSIKEFVDRYDNSPKDAFPFPGVQLSIGIPFSSNKSKLLPPFTLHIYSQMAQRMLEQFSCCNENDLFSNGKRDTVGTTKLK